MITMRNRRHRSPCTNSFFPLDLSSSSSSSCHYVNKYIPHRVYDYAYATYRRCFSSSSPSSSFSSSSSPPPPPDGGGASRINSMEDFAKLLSNQAYQNIVVLAGAGASVNAGIPDFRTPGTGLYSQLQNYNLPYPEAIFDVQYYATKPQAFLNLAKEIWPGQDNGPKPTLTHSFIKLLQGNRMLRRIYTQNIDGLESIVGIDDEKLVECHGHFRSASCIRCGTSMNINKCKEIIFEYESNECGDDQKNSANSIPTCSKCGSYVKPDITFFGEQLPDTFQQYLVEDVTECDLLIVIGSTLLVHPVASIPTWIRNNKPSDHIGAPRVLINLDLVGDFDDDDLFLQGDCDETIQTLCQMMGIEWESELQQIYEEKQNTQ